MNIYKNCARHEYVMNRVKDFAKQNGLSVSYKTDMNKAYTTLTVKRCEPFDSITYEIDWHEVDDVYEVVMVIIDNIRESLVTPLKKNTSESAKPAVVDLPEIEKVIYNYPATIVFWADGTKTIMKCHVDDVYTREAGLAWCIAKKAVGGDDKFIDIFNKWVPKEESDEKDDFDQDVAYTNRTDKTCSNCHFIENSIFANPCLECSLSMGRINWKPAK